MDLDQGLHVAKYLLMLCRRHHIRMPLQRAGKHVDKCLKTGNVGRLGRDNLAGNHAALVHFPGSLLNRCKGWE